MNGAEKVKPPWMEREFLLSLVGIFIGTFLILLGKTEQGSIVVSSAVAGYAVSRGIAKRPANGA